MKQTNNTHGGQVNRSETFYFFSTLSFSFQTLLSTSIQEEPFSQGNKEALVTSAKNSKKQVLLKFIQETLADEDAFTVGEDTWTTIEMDVKKQILNAIGKYSLLIVSFPMFFLTKLFF